MPSREKLMPAEREKLRRARRLYYAQNAPAKPRRCQLAQVTNLAGLREHRTFSLPVHRRSQGTTSASTLRAAPVLGPLLPTPRLIEEFAR